MPTIVQYSPPSPIAPYFQQYGFAYKLHDQAGYVVTTMNRIRKYVRDVFGIPNISRRMIEAIIYEISGKVLGAVANTEGHIATACFFHMWSFHRRVEIAIRNREIRLDTHKPLE